MLKAIYQYLQQLPHDDNNVVYFDTPVRVPATATNFQEANLWAACFTPAGTVMVMDTEQQWHTLEQRPEDAQAIEALFYKVRYLVQQAAVKLREVSL